MKKILSMRAGAKWQKFVIMVIQLIYTHVVDVGKL